MCVLMLLPGRPSQAAGFLSETQRAAPPWDMNGAGIHPSRYVPPPPKIIQGFDEIKYPRSSPSLAKLAETEQLNSLQMLRLIGCALLFRPLGARTQKALLFSLVGRGRLLTVALCSSCFSPFRCSCTTHSGNDLSWLLVTTSTSPKPMKE